MNKRFHSMVRRVVLVPMSVMLFFILLIIGVSLFGLLNMQERLVDGYANTARIALNRMDMRLTQVDNAFIEYWNYSEDHAFLKKCRPDTPIEEYVVYQSGAIEWMWQLTRSYPELQGAFMSYENLERVLFRGSSNLVMHQYIRSCLDSEETVYNRWRLVELDGQQFLLIIKRYGTFRGGVWLPASALLSDLGAWDRNGSGTLFIRDEGGVCAASNPDWDAELTEQGGPSGQIRIEKESFYSHLESDPSLKLSMGVLISQQSLLEGIPLVNWGLLVLTLCSVILVPVTVLWLRRKIAQPVRAIDQGMQRIGAGEMDYRIPAPDKNYYDEFDRLVARFNQMTDDLNDLEYRLYITTIRQQRAELRYVSQQIRPHFILNALNLIYTCEESEFPLVRKMVLYLTEYFRYIVNLKVDFVEVQQELRHVENYLNIQKERYLDRFDFVVEWESQAEHVPIPPLLIQSFVENCVKYGMKSEGETLIYVLAGIEDGQMKLTVADTGRGFSAEVLERLDTFLRTRQPQEGLGVGIQNAVERVDILYGEPANIRFFNQETGGAVVELRLPLTAPEQDGERRCFEDV